ncbi:MAG: starch-binding protein [Clostridiales bacterium]|nr:starch-binding protein [Clostridiales bacterium]
MLGITENNNFETLSNLPLNKMKPLNIVSMNEYKKLKKDSYELADKCENGVIFHAWNWYYKDVINNLREIAEAGFTTIQVSPVQPNKGGNFSRTYDWWQFYQPIDFTVGNVLGTANDFKEMCKKAKEYGIKIIVDVVTNHLANNSGKGNHAKWDRFDKIPHYLKDNDNFWLEESYGAFNNNDYDRVSMTQGAIGMPGLNTKNIELQDLIIDFLNYLQDLGADGFRFDAAKHIELPTDPVSSEFWPRVTSGIKSKNSDSFIYGEILNECGTDIKNYTKYIRVTDNIYGWNVIDSVLNCNAALAQNYTRNDLPKNLITWVESHDTYAGDYGRKSNNISDLDIKLAWCIVASRADTIPLYYVRPTDGLNGTIGGPGNPSWKDPMVSAINKFHNHFAGKNEYIRILNNNTIFEIERGDSGVVIVNLSNNTSFINTQTNLKDGTYKDRISGEKIYVQNGHLSTEICGKSVLVIYEISEIKYDFNLNNTYVSDYEEGYIYAENINNWNNEVYAYIYSGDKILSYWPGVKMNKISNNNFYLDLPLEWQNENTQVIFNDGKNNQFPYAFNPGANYKPGTAMVFNGYSIDFKPTYIDSMEIGCV